MELVILLAILWYAGNYRKIHRILCGDPAPSDQGSTPSDAVEMSMVSGAPLRVILDEADTVGLKWHTEIFFDVGDPRDWEDYHGQKELKEFVQLQIDVLPASEGLKHMFIAPKGAGKTTLFRIIADKLQKKRGGRYVETTPALLRTKKQLDDLMLSLSAGDILAIDEVHMFDRKMADVLLPAIEDGIYPFADGMRRLPEAITWIGATTDVGLLPPAFQDRFHILPLERLSHDDLVSILTDQRFPIRPDAADEVARRSTGSPRELKRVYRVARDVAVVSASNIITKEHCIEAFRLLNLDENGLYQPDRDVLTCLYKNPKRYASGVLRHAHSERAIRAFTGIDESTYRDAVEPKLLSLGFLTIGTGGRELTDKALATYFN